ncbi:MAG: hypothetical protein JWO94_3703, partial [Verrucomicrobiaceae bacterium]|nr:hypothetical protein [Verrucomicrobiaceae bacterium]
MLAFATARVSSFGMTPSLAISQDLATRVRQYLAAMPPAISGSGGHAATFKAAVVLVRGFALSEGEALPLLGEWNDAFAQSPWREADLRHKLRCASRSPRAAGYLLGGNEARSQPRPRLAPDFESEDELKARLRRLWPAFTPLTLAQRHAVAQRRGLPFVAVDLAHKFGLLAAAQVDGHASFILHEGR